MYDDSPKPQTVLFFTALMSLLAFALLASSAIAVLSVERGAASLIWLGMAAFLNHQRKTLTWIRS